MKILFPILCFWTIAALELNAQTTLDKTIQHGGMTREYKIYIPASYDSSQATPLVFNLHGYTSNNAQQFFYADFRPIADTANFILVLPNGTFDPSNNRFWNAGFGPTTIVDDVSFLNALIDSVAMDYHLDPARIYSTGMSNGGFMSYELACQSNRFAAIASVTGTMSVGTFGTCAPSRPFPIMEIHGTADGTVPYTGNSTMTAIDTVLQYWATFNNCPTPPTITPVPNLDTTDGATAEHWVYAAGDSGVTIEHFKVFGGGHTWPSAPITIGVTCHDFVATVEIWRFFSQFTHPSPPPFTVAVGVEHTSLSANKMSIYPNPVSHVLTVQCPTNTAFETMAIYDIYGKMVLQTNVQTNTNQEINVQELPQGVYILRANDGKSWFSARFVKN